MGYTILESFLDNFSFEIRERVNCGVLPHDWITAHHQHKENWLHAALWGALIQAVPWTYIPLIEPRLRDDNPSFEPDLVILDTQRRKIAVIEYECTRSSDTQRISTTWQHYEEAIVAHPHPQKSSRDSRRELPKLWLIISTLPDDIPECSHGSRQTDISSSPPTAIQSQDIVFLTDHENSIHDACRNVWKRITAILAPLDRGGMQLAWANITQTHLRVMNLNGVPRTEGSTYPDFAIFP